MEAFAWPLAIVVLVLAIFLILILRFPGEMRSVLVRITRIQFSPTGIAIDFLSAAIKEKENREASRAELERFAVRLPKIRILWVDDNPSNNQLEARALRELGAEIDFATSNAEAVAHAKAKTYDLVISDIGRAPPQAPTDGLNLPSELEAVRSLTRLVYYVGRMTAPATTHGYPVYAEPSKLFEAVAQLRSEVGYA